MATPPRVVYIDEITQAQTTHYTLDVDVPATSVSFDEAERVRKRKNGEFFRHRKSGQFILAIESGRHTAPKLETATAPSRSGNRKQYEAATLMSTSLLKNTGRYISESPRLVDGQLVDEALQARRKKRLSVPQRAESDNEFEGRLQTIESLLMRLVGQGDVSFRIQDVCLALLQDVLAEAHATRRLSWESLVLPQLREKGVDGNELERQFMLQVDQAKDYTYGVAERIKESQETAE